MSLHKSVKPLLITFVLLLASLSLSAWSVGDFYLGNRTPSFSARSLGMGNTGVFDTFSPFSLYLNPANVTMMNGRAGLTVDGLFTRNEDNRSLPLYNSFDTFIDDATYSSNINLFDDYGFGGYYKLSLNDKFKFGAGLNYLPIVNFKGVYDEQVRNNRGSDNDGYPEIIAKNMIDSNGRLNALNLSLGGGLALNADSQINLGIGLSSLSGSIDYEKSIKWSEWAMQQSINSPALRRNVLPDSVYTNKSDLSGLQFSAGTSIKIGSRLGLGISFVAGTELDRDNEIRIAFGPDTTMAIPSTSVNMPTAVTDTLIADKYTLPFRVRFGFNYEPRNIMKTYFNAELEYVSWSEVSKLFKDSWDIHVGVEHKVTNRIPMRLGFQSQTEWQALPDYFKLDEEGRPTLEAIKIITPSITAGSSFNVMKNVDLDIGLSFSWREYQALDLFTDSFYNDRQHTSMTSYLLWPNSYIYPTDRGWDNADKVRESFTHLSAGLTWTF